MKEYQLEYWTEKLDYVRACFGYKPTTEGKTRRHSIGMSRKDVLNKKKTSEPVAKKRD